MLLYLYALDVHSQHFVSMLLSTLLSILKRLSNKTCLTNPHQEYQFWNDESVRVWDMNDLNKSGFQGLTIPVK